jgi:hypothetical protein
MKTVGTRLLICSNLNTVTRRMSFCNSVQWHHGFKISLQLLMEVSLFSVGSFLMKSECLFNYDERHVFMLASLT